MSNFTPNLYRAARWCIALTVAAGCTTSGGGNISALAPPGAASPDLACFRRPVLNPTSMHFDSVKSPSRTLYVKCGMAIVYYPTNCDDRGVADIAARRQVPGRGYKFVVSPLKEGRCHRTFFSETGQATFHVTVVVQSEPSVAHKDDTVQWGP